jgi:hypothetical protein
VQAATCAALVSSARTRSVSLLKLTRLSGPGRTGNGCVGEYHSVGTSPFGTGRSSTGISGLPVTRSSTNM